MFMECSDRIQALRDNERQTLWVKNLILEQTQQPLADLLKQVTELQARVDELEKHKGKPDLSAGQWQAIAENLAEHLEYGCFHMRCKEECGLLCSTPKSREMCKEDWIKKAKEELGYE